MSDIVKHLRAGHPCRSEDRCRIMDSLSGCLCAMAADTIEARRDESDRLTFALSDARMEIATLREAMEVILRRASPPAPGDETSDWLRDLRHIEAAARAALAKATQP